MSTVNDAALKDAIQMIESLQKRYNPHVEEFDQKRTQEFFERTGQTFDFGSDFAADRMKDLLDAKKAMFSKYESPTWFSVVSRLSGDIEREIYQKSEFAGHKKIVFGTLNTGRINGMAIGIDNPEYHVILLESGLFGFANLLAKGLAQSFPMQETDGGAAHFSTDLTKVTERLQSDQDLSWRIIDLVLAYVIAGNPHAAKPYLPQKEYVLLLSIWRDAIEYFVLGHEYGHAINGDLEKKEDGAGEDFRDMPPGWIQEFKADYVGCVVTLNILSKAGYNPSLSYAGIEAFFLGVELIERALAMLQNRKINEEGTVSHPPAAMRREALRYWLQEALPKEESEAAIGLAKIFEEVLDLIWTRLEKVIAEVRNDGGSAHEKWSNY